MQHTDTFLTYRRAEVAFFCSFSPEQNELFFDKWAPDEISMSEFLGTLSREQEALALRWAQRLQALIEESIIAAARKKAEAAARPAESDGAEGGADQPTILNDTSR